MKFLGKRLKELGFLIEKLMFVIIILNDFDIYLLNFVYYGDDLFKK